MGIIAIIQTGKYLIQNRTMLKAAYLADGMRWVTDVFETLQQTMIHPAQIPTVDVVKGLAEKFYTAAMELQPCFDIINIVQSRVKEVGLIKNAEIEFT
jgi:hypothetical protein